MKNIQYILRALLITFWLVFFHKSDSYYGAYLIVGLLSYFCLYKNNKLQYTAGKHTSLSIICISCIFSFMVLTANYQIFSDLRPLKNMPAAFNPMYYILIFIIAFYSGFITFNNVFKFFSCGLQTLYLKKEEYTLPAKYIFMLSMLSIFAVNTFFMFICAYPGLCTSDSLSQVSQALKGAYSNHHPFYHTLIIKLFLMIGINIFNDINIGVLLYTLFQILFMAICFAYIIVTLYQMQISRYLIILCNIWYIVMPYHIDYSFVMLKDTLFGGFTALFITAAFRSLKNIGTGKNLNLFMLVIGSVGMCLFRSNGWFAFLLTFFCFILLFWKKQKKLGILLGIILVLTFVLKHPVLNYLNVAPPDTIEALSVPAQQIARVIYDGGVLNEAQTELLGKVIDIEQVKDTYTPWISDPIKNLVRASNNQKYLTEHKAAFIKLYIELGLSQPQNYIQAWIDLTKGYWNGGYKYNYWGRWESGSGEDSYGIKTVVYSENIHKWLESYIDIYQNNFILMIFVSIGFHVWIIIGIAFLSLIWQRREVLFITIPVISIIISLMISTPVYSLLRYAYAVFCCIPLIIFALFFKSDSSFDA